MKLYKIYMFVSLLITSHFIDAKPLLVVTEDLWPFNYIESNEIKGPHTRFIKAMLKLSDIEYTIEVLPWARSYKLATERANVLIYTINKTPERLNKFHWIGDFPTKSDTYYYALTRSNYTDLSLSQLKTLRIGTQINTANDNYITKHQFKQISRVTHIRQTIGMLKRGRIDLVIASPLQIQKAAKETGLDLKKLTIVNHAFSTNPAIAVSLLTSDKTVKSLKQAYIKMNRRADFCTFTLLNKSSCLVR